MDWYETTIEPGVRGIVRALRDKGINTVSSCGHEMLVQCETYDPSEEWRTVYNVLVGDFGLEDWTMEIRWEVRGGCVCSFAEIRIGRERVPPQAAKGVSYAAGTQNRGAAQAPGAAR